jgi:hypothetical protein
LFQVDATAMVPAPVATALNTVVATRISRIAPPRNRSLTKLPMPPGINQSDLESIDSPPSGVDTPEPEKPKTPPRRSIKDLPMPPGIWHYVIT